MNLFQILHMYQNLKLHENQLYFQFVLDFLVFIPCLSQNFHLFRPLYFLNLSLNLINI